MKNLKNKTYILITLIILAVSATSFYLSYSYSWFMANILSNKNLDYVIYSDSIVFLDFSSNEMFARLTPAEALEGAVASGLTLGDIFDGTEVEYIDSNADIGAIQVDLAYYGQEGSSNMLDINCSVSVEIDGVVYDVGEDVNYMVCAYSDNFSMASNWLLTGLPGNCWLNDGEGNYIDYELDIANNNYLLTTNTSHEELLRFGVDNYLTVCTYDTSTSGFIFDSNYAAFDTEAAFKTMVADTIAASGTDFEFNELNFVIGSPSGTVYTVYEDVQAPDVLVNEELQLKFLIFVWYNKVDELLSPAISIAQGMTLSVSVGAGAVE